MKMYSYYFAKNGKICPKCKKETLWLDDVDYQFKGCQDEYIYCLECPTDIFVKVRYNNICKITIDNRRD